MYLFIGLGWSNHFRQLCRLAKFQEPLTRLTAWPQLLSIKQVRTCCKTFAASREIFELTLDIYCELWGWQTVSQAPAYQLHGLTFASSTC